MKFIICLSFFVTFFMLPICASALDTSAPNTTVKLIFIHHSCGENWLADEGGGLGLSLMENNYYTSDTNYGWGTNSIGDRTDIGQWWEWFNGPQSTTYLSELYSESGDNSYERYSRLAEDPGGENEIIIFKSCYPNSNLHGLPDSAPTTGDNPLQGQDFASQYMTVANAKGIYADLLDYFSTRQDKLFIAITAPPLSKSSTDPSSAANIRAFNNWLVNSWLDDYEYNNVAVFDFYNVLTSNGGDAQTNDAESVSGNHHRLWNGKIQHQQTYANNYSAYPTNSWDSHPTSAGNQKATKEFLPLLNAYYNQWKDSLEQSSPELDIKANGQDDLLSVSSTDSVSITVSLDPGDKKGQNSDWWIITKTPFEAPANFYSYVYPQGWLQGINLCLQGPMLEIGSPVEVLNAILPEGNYTFFFALDKNTDGNPDGTWLDMVKVEVK